MILKCPSCHKIIEEGDEFEQGDILYCSTCDSEVEIIGLAPVRLRNLTSSEKDNDDIYEEDNY